VASHVYKKVLEIAAPVPTATIFDGMPVYEHRDASGNQYSFVATHEVQSHQYAQTLSEMETLFSDCDFAGIVNWHEGNNAPDHILTVHSTGDVPSGIFAKSNPFLFRNLLRAIHRILADSNLTGFRVRTEATHWSGIMYGSRPELLKSFGVPTYDIEIGSSAESWSNPEAASVLAKALLHVFDSAARPKTLLAMGGVHFEESFGDVMLNDDYPVSMAHILPNQWVVSGKYEEPEGMDKLLSCVNEITERIDGIVFHDNLKSNYKQQCRLLAQKLSVPVFKHQLLRDPKRLQETMRQGKTERTE
jgi:D-tyrosyl-tRNA(Tyr) deacylase